MIYIELKQEFSDVALLEHAARLTLDTSVPVSDGFDFALASADMTIVLTDDEQLHELNREYLGVDAPTDVLSFPAAESDPETGTTYLGDILISIPRATQQAQAAGHSVEDEVQLLVVHGTLHLLGHDHATAMEKPACGKPRLRCCQVSDSRTSKSRTLNEILFFIASHFVRSCVSRLALCFTYAGKRMDSQHNRRGCIYSGALASTSGT